MSDDVCGAISVWLSSVVMFVGRFLFCSSIFIVHRPSPSPYVQRCLWLVTTGVTAPLCLRLVPSYPSISLPSPSQSTPLSAEFTCLQISMSAKFTNCTLLHPHANNTMVHCCSNPTLHPQVTALHHRSFSPASNQRTALPSKSTSTH